MIGCVSPRSTIVYLVRHGESLLNRDKRVSGQFDTPLSPEGVQRSQALADQLREVRLTAIYTSALERTIETARPTAETHGLPIRSTIALNELHFGVLEGRFRDDRDPEAKVLWEARKRDKRHYRFPEGERFLDLAERVTASLKNILADEDGGTILIVGHRNTNRALFGMLMRQPEDQWPDVTLKSQYIYCLTTYSPPLLTTMAIKSKQTGLLPTTRTVQSKPRLTP
ncbi:MAG TPA: histidine phosphatase family protein [Nitrospira sp.]|nr:histidine phosphatase family protein [Nitrospira sp.]